MLPKHKTTICVASDLELTTPSYYNRLWLAIKNSGIRRRDWLDEIADAIRDHDGEIKTPCGGIYIVPDIDETFGDDPDVRWLGYFLAVAPIEHTLARRSRKIERLRLLDLYFRIRYPDIARHFA